MLERFFPDEYVDSAYGIPFEELCRKYGLVLIEDSTTALRRTPVPSACLRA